MISVFAYASQRLIDSGFWKNTLSVIELTPTVEGIITLPADAKSIVKILRLPKGCSRSIPINSLFTQFNNQGGCDCTQSLTPIEDGKYQLPPIDPAPIFLALVVRKFIPLVDTDQMVYPDNMLALRYAVQAVNYEDKNDIANAKIYWDQAFGVLESEQEQIILGEEKSINVSTQMPRIVNLI